VTANLVRVYALALLLGLGGCATDVANRYYLKERLQPRSVEEVEILWARPAREFIVMADFQSRGESPQDIRDKAAQIGADAVIVSLLGGVYSKSEEWASDDRNRRTYSRISGTAILYVK
jgi:hypothetical protein